MIRLPTIHSRLEYGLASAPGCAGNDEKLESAPKTKLFALSLSSIVAYFALFEKKHHIVAGDTS